MKPKGNNNQPQDLDRMLRDYLLRKDPMGPEGERLMEQSAHSVLGNTPLVAPSPEKEAEMLRRLKAEASPTPRRGRLLWFGVSVFSAAAALALLLWIGPGSAGEKTVYGTALIQGTYDESFEFPSDAFLADVDLNEKDNENELNGMVPVKRPDIRKKPVAEVLPFVYREKDRENGVEEDRKDPAPNAVDPYPMRELFAMARPRAQYLQLDPEEDHLVEGGNGSLLHIPASCFVTKDGRPVEGKVQVELREYYRPSDFVAANITTVSNGRPLVSGGAVYLQATQGGERLRVAPGKSIYVEMASREASNLDMRLYTGQRAATGEMNWAPMQEEAFGMIPLPLNEMHWEEFWCRDHRDMRWNNLLIQLDHPDFEGTYIATLEFRERLKAIFRSGHTVDLLDIYLENTDKNLWQVDLMAADWLLSKPYGADFTYPDERVYQAFAQEMLTKPEGFDPRLDLEASDLRTRLRRTGYSEAESDRLARVRMLREQYVADLRRAFSDDRKGKGNREADFASLSVRSSKRKSPQASKGWILRETGWAHMNRPLGQDYLKDHSANLLLKLKGAPKNENLCTFLVYRGMLSLIPGRLSEGGDVEFRDVPAGQQAWVVAVGFDGLMPYLAMRKINLDDDHRESMQLTRVSYEDFLSRIRKLDA